jgi:serine/threonine protein kinase
MLLPHDPKEIGGIQILDRLGSGGAGIVYKGRDKDNQIVALKVLHAEFANNQTVRKRLEREADAMRSVKGNRTVKIRRIEIDVVQPFIVMDFAEGENLANYIANNGVLKGQALNDFALQLAEAIRDIHKAKVIHRDLKPTNVIIGSDGLKVVDFGISIVSEVTGMTQTGILSGTASWLSPEQILGKDITEKTDIFNYGLVIGFAATGKHLFGEGKPEAVMFRILNTEPELNLLSRKMQTIIKDLISKEPSKRPDTIKNLSIIQETFLTTNEIESTKSNKIRRLNGSPYFKLPVLIGGLGTLIILIIGFYFIPIRGVEEKTVSLSALEKEKNTEDTDVIVIPKNTPIVTSSTLSSPSISAEIANPSPTPIKTENLFNNDKIVGNIIYAYSAFLESGYVEFTLFSESVKTKNERINYLTYQKEMIVSFVPLTPIERWNTIKSLIVEQTSVDVDLGAGFVKWDSQTIECDTPYGFGECELSLLGIEEYFVKNYKQKKIIKIKYNISPSPLLKNEQYMYKTDKSIDKITFEPASCQTIYDKMINPPKGFENIFAPLDKKYKSDLFNYLSNAEDCQ